MTLISELVTRDTEDQELLIAVSKELTLRFPIKDSLTYTQVASYVTFPW